MGYSCYQLHGRDQGYGVPCKCDHPDCDEEIHRGIAFACGGDPMENCGLFFCNKHLANWRDDDSHGCCERCATDQPAFDPKPDIQEWIDWKLTDESWAEWRTENPEWVAKHQSVTPTSSGVGWHMLAFALLLLTCAALAFAPPISTGGMRNAVQGPLWHLISS